MSSSAGHQSDQPSLRVILIGETDLEHDLASDRRVEFVHVSSTLQAVAELGLPEQGHIPSAILLGTSNTTHDQQLAVISALRSVDPDVRIVAPLHDHEWPARLVDATIEHPDDLFATEPKTEQASPLPNAHVGFSQSVAIAEAILAGNEPREAIALMLRHAAGQSDLELLPPGDPIPEGHTSAPITRRGTHLGLLTSAELQGDALHELARTAAPWIALSDQQRQLREAAFCDPLTGAANRRAFQIAFDAAIDAAARDRRSISLLLFDIDDFKAFNDRAGHQAGDAVLKHVVELFDSVVRTSDRICRIGGDEFAVIFDDPSGPRQASSEHPRTLEPIIKRLERALLEHPGPEVEGHGRLTLTISGGIATYPWDGLDRPALLHAADQRLMLSKADGKNRITLSEQNFNFE